MYISGYPNSLRFSISQIIWGGGVTVFSTVNYPKLVPCHSFAFKLIWHRIIFSWSKLHCLFIQRSHKVYLTSAIYDRHCEGVPFSPCSLIVKLNVSWRHSWVCRGNPNSSQTGDSGQTKTLGSQIRLCSYVSYIILQHIAKFPGTCTSDLKRTDMCHFSWHINRNEQLQKVMPYSWIDVSLQYVSV
jgi:hypothetical protein